MADKPRYRVQAGSAPLMAGVSPLATPPGIPGHPVASPFVAASGGRRLSGWRPTGSGPNAALQMSGGEMLRRSRDLRRNNPFGKRAMDLTVTHAIGTGIKPRSLCRNKRIVAALSELWDEWTRVSDADGVFDFYGQQALAFGEMVEGGEAFARLRPRQLSDGLPVPLQIQLIPSEQVPLGYALPSDGNPVLQGIERDRIGRRAGYWMYDQHPGDLTAPGVGISLMPKRVSAVDICHLYNQTRIGQLRGVPWLAAAMTSVHQAHAYLDAELLRKQMSAMLVAAIESPVGVDSGPDGLKAAIGVPAEDDIVTMEPGSVMALRAGEKITFNQPADVGQSFEPFMAATYRAVSSAANLIYEELTGNWKDTNDRTFRAAFNTFKRQVSYWQYSLMCVQFCWPVWSRFVDYAVASGALRVPKSVTDRDLKRVAWSPQRHAYINPIQDITATGEELTLGLTSRTAEILERGDDPEQVDQQIAEDRTREAEHGLAFTPGNIGAKAAMAADGATLPHDGATP
ncbi:Portal protein [Granulibacter bethesdensis]|uniref:Portal protein n=1 Tax=Granulibacter bethesdensis TaxID=364410 RepID=A0AAN0VFX5_9PROT|nr:phage portal protein [Granulibacter bethesdensis]AHJ63243.1 Portal protein [Granulibacter bethesdensis]